MKHWKEGRPIRQNTEQGREGLILKGADERILSVAKTDEGFTFLEECDAYFEHEYTKDEALELIDELRNWIEKQ